MTSEEEHILARIAVIEIEIHHLKQHQVEILASVKAIEHQTARWTGGFVTILGLGTVIATVLTIFHRTWQFLVSN